MKKLFLTISIIGSVAFLAANAVSAQTPSDTPTLIPSPTEAATATAVPPLPTVIPSPTPTLSLLPYICTWPRNNNENFFCADPSQSSDALTKGRQLGLCQMSLDESQYNQAGNWQLHITTRGTEGQLCNLFTWCAPGVDCLKFPQVSYNPPGCQAIGMGVAWNPAECTTCTQGQVNWNFADKSVSIANMQAQNDRPLVLLEGGDTHIEYPDSKVDYRIRIIEEDPDGINNIVLTHDFRNGTVGDGDPNVTCTYDTADSYDGRDSLTHRVSCSLNFALQNVSLQPGTPYLMRVWTKPAYGDESAWRQFQVCSSRFVAPTLTPTPTPSNTPTPTPTLTPTPIPTDTPTPIPTNTPTPIPTNTPTPTSTPVPTNTPTATPLPTNTPAPTATPEPTETPMPSETPVPTVTPTLEPTETPEPTPTPIISPSLTATPVPISPACVGCNIQLFSRNTCKSDVGPLVMRGHVGDLPYEPARIRIAMRQLIPDRGTIKTVVVNNVKANSDFAFQIPWQGARERNNFAVIRAQAQLLDSRGRVYPQCSTFAYLYYAPYLKCADTQVSPAANICLPAQQ